MSGWCEGGGGESISWEEGRVGACTCVAGGKTHTGKSSYFPLFFRSFFRFLPRGGSEEE